MKKFFKINFSGEWVMRHREDDELPIIVIANELEKMGEYEVTDVSLTSLKIFYEDNGLEPLEQQDRIFSAIEKIFPSEDIDEYMSVSRDDDMDDELLDEIEETSKQEKTPDEETKEKGTSELLKKGNGNEADCMIVRNKLKKLVGASEFKRLVEEIERIAPEIRSKMTYDIFSHQCYLFSIGEGCGLTTYLNLLSEIISATGLKKMHIRPVMEETLPPYKESMDPFEGVLRILHNGERDQIRLLCIDISEWMDKTNDRFFKQFLRAVEKNSENFIVVFRVPFVDKDVLERLKFSLNDLLYVRAVSFPPLCREEIKVCAKSEIESYGFKISAAAWEYFQERISEEKSDGKFYGLNTVKKVVRELIYNKQLNNALSKKSNNVITPKDAKALVSDFGGSNLSGEEQLERLVGGEKIKERIREIITQIEMSLLSPADRPCIHMRFVGNPGTGKTTVARIIGKILKEKGVLRIGNFYEYGGRDFCGRYVGETAPKTASICRDAYGSVLFIDEAYSLYRGNGNSNDFGKEAIDTLIAEMENHRNDFVVIMAGYTKDMETLMQSNLGLASRMPYVLEFPNFTREQLYEIFASLVKSKFKHDDEVLVAAKNFFMALSKDVLDSEEFSNARFVRNLFERTWAKAAMRTQLNNETKIVLTKDDFECASGEKEFSSNIPKKTKIGF